MKSISVELAQELIDFAPTSTTKEMGFGESQLHGAVAAYNMLATNGVAYLADEVGMGKTYVALGVLGLLRHLNPAARVMVIAPRENIQRKWIKELTNFVRQNWLVEDNRVKGLDGKPVYEPIACSSLDELATVSRVNDHRDVFLRMTSFSASVKTEEAQKRIRRRLLLKVPWIDAQHLRKRDPSSFRDWYGRVLNAIVPEIDLLIVDEAHNLRKGFGPTVSNRNRVLGLALGHPEGGAEGSDWYGRRIKRVLLLSATPFEYDYVDLYHQLDVLGFAKVSLRDENGSAPIRVKKLLDADGSDDDKKAVVSRLLLRRVSYLKINNKEYSKNMYRREWRRGGLRTYEEPLELTDTKQRLIVGLVQKKVAEVLGDRRFNNNFQIGMLSSFESFLESMGHKKRPTDAMEDDDEDKTFDGNQTDNAMERQGIDTFSLATVIRSYAKRFGESMPHPKLDATAGALSTAFDTGEKALVFVRRVATVSELKGKLDKVFDEWIRKKMVEALPNLTKKVDQIFDRYQEERRTRRKSRAEDSAHEDVDQVEEDLHQAIVDDEGGTDSFFAWFFRGEGPKGVVSGAAFQKNRLSSMASLYSILFEDDYASWLLGRPADPLTVLAEAIGRDRQSVTSELRELAYDHFRARSKQKEGYPRFYVFEAYQVAALRMLGDSSSDLSERAATILHDRFGLFSEVSLPTPSRFPGPEEAIGIDTFFTLLEKRPALREAIWPEHPSEDFRERFHDRERRRELISAMVRLGASYIDLYLLAIRQLNSFAVGTEATTERPARQLAVDFLDLLEQQRDAPGFHAYYELSSAAQTFETLMSVNFPEAHHARLPELAELFGRALQHQMPVGGVAGGVNKRLVRQFRMPGFPLVLATTDVLQEGEDLHTFCQNVIHYGITWTPSAMEQRTGRIDRIGSLVQRRLDGRAKPPEDKEFIQVYFPHLRDTVEVFQVRRVLERLNKFLRMIHRDTKSSESDETRIDVASEVLNKLEEVPRIEGLLESAFPVRDGWLTGELDATNVSRPNIGELEEMLATKWQWLVKRWRIEELRTGSRRQYAGICTIRNGRCVPFNGRGDEAIRKQPFELQLRSQVVGDATLIRCVSPVGWINLDQRAELDRLYELQRDLGMVKVCARHDPRKHLYDITVRGTRLFRLDTTQPEELEDLVIRTVEAADAIEADLLERDEDPSQWAKRGERSDE